MAEETGATLSDKNMFRSVYDDTIYFIDSIIDEYKIFPTILEKMKNGDATVELRKRYLLRAIDETWVNIIEDTLPALDTIIRNPSKFIEEKEELLPVEMTRKVSVRTLQHLAQQAMLAVVQVRQSNEVWKPVVRHDSAHWCRLLRRLSQR